MHFSCKIKKFYEGMQVYEHLLEDEKAIHIPFALSFTVTIATINGQLRTYLTDLENKVCREIPDIDFDLMSNVYNIMSPKLKHDLLAFGNKTVRQILEELFGEQLDKTPAEMYEYIFNNTKVMTEYLRRIRVLLASASPALFEDYVLRHIRDHKWDDVEDGYLKWRKYSDLTLDLLREKQEQELQQYLERGIMRFAPTPSIDKMKKVDYVSHTELLEFKFEDTVDYKVVYTQFMQFATRKDGVLIINLKKYGKYIFDYYYQFAEGQKVALFELIVILDLIHKDMVALNPELENHLMTSKSLVSLENTKLFAPYFHISKMLKQEWFKRLRADAKYDDEWADRFAESLMRSEYGTDIAETWKENRCQIMGYLLGCLKNAGVIKADASNDRIASEAGIMENTRSFGRYIGKESQIQPYADWIKEHAADL